MTPDSPDARHELPDPTSEAFMLQPNDLDGLGEMGQKAETPANAASPSARDTTRHTTRDTTLEFQSGSVGFTHGQPLLSAPASYYATVEDLSDLLNAAVTQKASDIVFKALAPPYMTIKGSLVRMRDANDQPLPPIMPSQMEEIAKALLGNKYETFLESRDLDFQFSTSVARFRVSAAFQANTPYLVLRTVPSKPPSLEQLNYLNAEAVIPILQSVMELPRGLILLTGPTGCGKSTTLAGMINYINQRFSKHIITIEDPVEFVHKDNRSMLIQRELGTDTTTYERALRAALRQAPNIILLGEMRDSETIMAALTAAETGHLVISTIHTDNAPGVVSRILDAMPGDRINQVKAQLAGALKCVITQQLVPMIEGDERQVVLEIMVVDDVVSNLILTNSSDVKFYDYMLEANNKSILMDQQLAYGVLAKVITAESAEGRAIDTDRFHQALRTVTVTAPKVTRQTNAWTRS